jgi:ferredoxin-NADP reductase
MARAAVLGRLTWQVATVTAVREETPTARTIVLDVPDWPGHQAGQHVDVRLTAEDGYSAQRSYSIASAPPVPGLPMLEPTVLEQTALELTVLELTVQRLADGEVSPYLADILEPGDLIELRGPIGGWFVWDPADPGPVLLVAGGSGIVPLMSMIRARAGTGSRAPFRLIYSVREPDAVLYAGELAERARTGDGLDVTYVYTRSTPPGWPVPAGRINAGLLTAGQPAPAGLAVFVCGPTSFVETAANLLVDAGQDPGTIKTERFGPSGGQQ